tara:strand:+ start:3152 stop:4042 length:891 start_codon:yes stop_codon:yes gene_type:complete
VKQFDQFITEARITRASTQAKRIGLVGDGHGDWYDRQGQLKAKTVRGELKMFDAKAAAKDEDEREKNSQSLASRSGATATATATAGGAGQVKPDVDRMGRALSNFQAKQQFDQAARNEPLTVAFDKFDDDVVGDNIIATAAQTSEEFYIFPSRDADIKRLKEAHPDLQEAIIDDANAETIYDVLQSIYENGYNSLNIVVRQSRAQEIAKLALEQNGKLYNYVMLNVIPVDERTLREQYVSGDLFKVGTFVESGDSVGKIIRRGANHLICVDDDAHMFRTWITECREVGKFNLGVDF